MKITVLTDVGDVVENIREDDIGDLTTWLGRQDLADMIVRAIASAKAQEAEERKP